MTTLQMVCGAGDLTSDVTHFRTGDLIFTQPPLDPKFPVNDAILAVGNATIAWLRAHGVEVPANNRQLASHVAIAWRNASAGGTLSFIEATPPVVQLTPAGEFVCRWAGASLYAGVFRSASMRRHGERAAQFALTQLGKPYSVDFEPPPSSFYCSSLVEWAYERASREKHVFVQSTFYLIFVPRDFWVEYYARRNLTLPPPNMTGTNPTLLLHSPYVRYHTITLLALAPPATPTLSVPQAPDTRTPEVPLLSAVGGTGGDLRDVSIELSGSLLWAAGSLEMREAGRWRGGNELKPLGQQESKRGHDALGGFTRLSRVYGLESQTLVELGLRMYDGGDRLVFEQAFPQGLNASSIETADSDADASRGAHAGSSIVGLAPILSWPSFEISGKASMTRVWRSWHGSYGSFTGVGLSAQDTLVFNGVPTMPLLFLPPSDVGSGTWAPCVMVSPLSRFKDAAHAAVSESVATDMSVTRSNRTSWRHGPSSRFTSLPPGYTFETLLLASSQGPTATVSAWGDAMRTWARTDRSEALAADIALRSIGYWTDNGAYYNFVRPL